MIDAFANIEEQYELSIGGLYRIARCPSNHLSAVPAPPLPEKEVGFLEWLIANPFVRVTDHAIILLGFELGSNGELLAHVLTTGGPAYIPVEEVVSE